VQLQAALQWPHHGDDKNRERERRKHTRGLISRDGNGQADYDPSLSIRDPQPHDASLTANVREFRCSRREFDAEILSQSESRNDVADGNWP
jgi:hypothetical protein